MPYAIGITQRVAHIARHEYVMVAVLILLLKGLMFALSLVLQHGGNVLSWQAVAALPTLWNRWDAGWYLHIAEHGYGSEESVQRSIAFYPLYPWLIRLAYGVVHHYPVAALAVSNLSSILGGVMFYALARLEFTPCVALWSLVALLLFPTGYFFHAGYSEGLFLPLSAGAFYAARRRHWPLAGLLGAGAALTRTPGLLLLPALGVEWYAQQQGERKAWSQVVWLGVILLGWLCYLLINLEVYGTPLAFLSAQEKYWQVTLDWPWVSLEKAWMRTRLLLQLVNGHEAFIHGGAHLGAVALLLISIVWGRYRLRASYTVFLVLVTLQVTSLHFLLSTPRLMLSGFPLFLMLGYAAQYPSLRLAWFALALPLLWILQGRFVAGQWAF
jgi:hypothetical protein